MTPEELTEVAFYCRKKFNSPLSILYRMFDLKTNMRTFKKLITYLLYNPLFRKEVHKKQGLQFGIEHFREVKMLKSKIVEVENLRISQTKKMFSIMSKYYANISEVNFIMTY